MTRGRKSDSEVLKSPWRRIERKGDSFHLFPRMTLPSPAHLPLSLPLCRSAFQCCTHTYLMPTHSSGMQSHEACSRLGKYMTDTRQKLCTKMRTSAPHTVLLLWKCLCAFGCSCWVASWCCWLPAFSWLAGLVYSCDPHQCCLCATFTTSTGLHGAQSEEPGVHLLQITGVLSKNQKGCHMEPNLEQHDPFLSVWYKSLSHLFLLFFLFHEA